MSISMIGLDTAKSVFQIHGVNETGKVEIKRKIAPQRVDRILRETRKLHGGDGGLWRRASPGHVCSPASGHMVKLIAAEVVKPLREEG